MLGESTEYRAVPRRTEQALRVCVQKNLCYSFLINSYVLLVEISENKNKLEK